MKEENLFDFSSDMAKKQSIEKNVKCNESLRVDLDVLLQKLKVLNNPRERLISFTKIQEIMMWLRMNLKRLNQPNPYTDNLKF